jgi:hypothetical protein
MISKIFGAIKQTLETTLRNLGQPLPSHELGAWHIGEHDAPPRIVWEVVGGPVGPPNQLSAEGNRQIKQIGTRQERCRIHIWDEDFTATEVLMNHFVAAARADMTGFSFSPLSTHWLVAQTEKTVLGRLCILEVEIRIPLTAEPIAISHPPHPVTITGTIHQPS